MVINDETLPTIIEQEVSRSIGHWDGSLSESRAQEFNYYYGKPFGNEVEGESQVVSTDVADTVEGMLPIILEIFTKSDDVVRFDPNGPEDEEQAKQQTEVANYVFYRQNNGFLVLYQWFKDALIQKNGIVKYWWDEKTENTKEEYKGLTEVEYQTLMNDKSYMEIEELEHSTYDDPMALQKLDQMKVQISQQVPPEMQAQALAQIESQPIPQAHDVVVRIKKDVSKICIEAIPPEEFGISADTRCVSIQDTTFCHHTRRMRVSTLREMGCPEELLVQVSADNDPDITPESLARDRYVDDRWKADTTSALDKEVLVTDCFIRVDYDGDGIAELRHVIKVGRLIWVNEECDHINFAALTPIIMPHRWIGRSVAELVMDIQFTKSVIWRQMLNNLYLTNNPRKAVLSSAGGIVQANLDDLLTSRPGGIMREYVQGAIRNEEVPFVAGASFPMLEYMDSIKETRTGVTRYNQGTDADTLNKTARGIQMIQAAGQQRTALIARIFAETGVKDLMRGIVYMLSKYGSKAMTLKLRNQWVNVDPREWKTQYNMTVNVGLGTGSRDVQIAHLANIHAQQLELMKMGRGYMVSDENIFNLYRKASEAMGFKHPELFVTDPQRIPPQAKQKPPNPEFIKIQQEAQKDKAKLAMDDKKLMVDAKLQEMIAQIQAQAQLAIADMNNAAKKEIEAMKLQAQGQLAVFDKQNQLTDQSKQVEKVALEKGTQLDLRELEIQYREQMLALKSQIEQMAEARREELTQESDGKSEARENKVVQTVQISLDAIGKTLGQIGNMLNEQATLNRGAIETLQKPQAIKIENVKTDKEGRIVGAEISKTIQ